MEKNENIWAAEAEKESLEDAAITTFKYIMVAHRRIVAKLV